MTDKQKKIARICTVTGVILVFIALVALIVNIITLSVKSAQKADLERRSAELQEQIDNLQDDLEYRNTKEFVERYARDHFNMIYPDEVVYEPTDKEEE